MKIECANGNLVVNWYDRSTRSSVIQVTDRHGSQIGEAFYVGGGREEVSLYRETLVAENGGRASPSLNEPVA